MILTIHAIPDGPGGTLWATISVPADKFPQFKDVRRGSQSQWTPRDGSGRFTHQTPIWRGFTDE